MVPGKKAQVHMHADFCNHFRRVHRPREIVPNSMEVGIGGREWARGPSFSHMVSGKTDSGFCD